MHVDLPEKQYYRIGEVAEAFGEATSLIRFWEREFNIIQPKKNKKGNRMFTPKDIENFKLIYNLVKERGYTLEGAKQYLKKNKDAESNHELISRLQRIRAELVKLREQLDN